MPNAHARFAPSASGRWIPCPGSIPLSEQLLADGKIPADSSGDAAKRGTAMHDASEGHLLKGTNPHNYDAPIKYKGGEVSVEDWKPHVINYVEFVREQTEAMSDTTGKEATLEVEAKVQIQDDDCWGSVDAHWYAATSLYVNDLKTGFNVVSPEDNNQFLTYAVGIMNDHKWKFEDIVLGRSQIQDAQDPNASCEVSKAELLAHRENIRIAIADAKSDNPTFEAGEHCKYCPAAAHCTKKMEQVVAIFDDTEETPTLPAIDTITDDQMREVLALRKDIEAFFKAIDAHITTTIEGGGKFKGFKLVAGRSSRKWNPDMLDQIVQFSDMLGVNPFKTQELRGIGDVEKDVGKGNLDQFMIKPEGKPTLAKDTDKRPAIAIASIFDDDII